VSGVNQRRESVLRMSPCVNGPTKIAAVEYKEKNTNTFDIEGRKRQKTHRTVNIIKNDNLK
jgi:hypothetical protein